MKQSYVAFVRGARRLAEWIGLIGLLDKLSQRSKVFLWIRSLFAIYDFGDLTRLGVPWWTFRSVDYVESFLSNKESPAVFERGSGSSTVWLSTRCEKVVSVEHDEAWAKEVQNILPSNVFLKVREGDEVSGEPKIRSARKGFTQLDFSQYVNSISEDDEKYDLIIIDGRARDSCLNVAADHLRDSGIILYDNVERRRNLRAVKALDDRFKVLITSGLTPCLPYPSATAIISFSQSQ